MREECFPVFVLCENKWLLLLRKKYASSSEGLRPVGREGWCFRFEPETDFGFIRRLKYIVRVVVGLLLGLYLLLLFGLNATPVQQWMGRMVASVLHDRLQTSVSVERMEVGLFNRVTLRNVEIDDRSGKSLLEARSLSAKIEIMPLLHGEVSLRMVSVLDGKINLCKATPKAEPNFQFILDAFKKEDDDKPSSLNLRINSVVLRRCDVAYDEHFRPATPGALNPGHLHVQGLDANVSLKRLTPDSLNLRVRSFKMAEQSGLVIDRMSLRLSGNRKGFSVSGFELSMPHGTHLEQEALQATYDMDAPGGLWQTLRLTGRLRQARVATDDVAFVFPKLRALNRQVEIATLFSIRPQDISLTDIRLSDADADLSLSGDVLMRREAGKVVAMNAEVGGLHLKNDLLQSVVALFAPQVPTVVARVGDVDFKGGIDYRKQGESKAEGTLTTAAGTMNARVGWMGTRLEAHLKSDSLNPSMLLEAKGIPHRVAFNLEGEGDMARQNPMLRFAGRIDQVALPEYTYKDIEVSGDWRNRRFTARLNSSDPNAKMNTDVAGRFDGKRVSALTVSADVESFCPHVLGLTKKYAGVQFASHLEAQIAGVDLKNPDLSLHVSDFAMLAPEKPYYLNRLDLKVHPVPEGSHLNLASDFAVAEVVGPFSWENIKACARRMISESMPSLTDVLKAGKPSGNLRLSARIFNTDFLPALLDVPLTLQGTATLEGVLKADSTRSTLSLYAPGIIYGKNQIDDIRLYVRGEDGRLALLAQAETEIKGSNMELVLDAAASEDKLFASLDWDDSGKHRYRGALSTMTEIGQQGTDKEIRTTLIPTTISINDTVWNVASGEFAWNGNLMSIDRFSLKHETSALTIDGRLGRETGDSIIADLKNIDVSYILDLVNFHAVEFKGHATGRALLSSSLKNPKVDARLRVPDFHFNGAFLGDADIRGGWNNREKQIKFDAKMTEEGMGWTTVEGYVSPPRKCLDLHIGSENTNLAFLNRYVTGIFGSLEGRVSGHTRLHGPFKELDFEGKEQGRVSAKILATGVTYYLSGGSIDLSAGRFAFNNMDVEDGLGGRGRISGFLGHKHLKEMTYGFRLEADNMLVYDKPKSVDMPFYATVYGTGSVELKGEPGHFNADINLRPDENTTFTYTIDTPEALGDVQFLTFGNRAVSADSTDHDNAEAEAAPVSGTDIRLNFLLDMNESAAMKIIMDEKSGDNIAVTGNGIMRASFHNKGDFQMYGTYTVKEGKYRLSIQDFIRKELEMAEDSRLTFAGNPQKGTLDLKAVYVVNSASLSDLNIGSSLSESSTRVNCILNIRGEVQNPEVSFDLELPSVSADEMQMVRNLISTEEDMNMQILYLLGVGRFYTYDYSTTETAARQSQSSVAMKSFLSSTLSSQLNEIIGNAIGNSNWTFGTNLSTGSVGWSDMEVEGILSGRLLNNRLLFNGNFGYRDRPVYNNSNFVGDFDIRYLLTPGGGVSLKAYSETNDRYFTKSSLTTQGIGVMLKRDFYNFKDLFTPNRRGKKQKTEARP